MAPDDQRKSDLQALVSQLEALVARQAAQAASMADVRTEQEAQRADQEGSMADLLAAQKALRQRLDALIAEQDARPPRKPEDYHTTIAQVRQMAQKDIHQNWFMAAYADLAGRMTQMEARLDDITDSLRMILGQLAALERQDREE